MNICITGALGHIGSKLIRQLNSSHIKTVHLVDNLYTQRFVSLFDLPEKPNFVFHEIDINDPAVEDIIKKTDLVIHLAAITDAETSAKKKGIVNRVNRNGLKNVATLCLKYKKPIIFPSTTSVYGSQHSLVDENCTRDDLRPQSPYAHSKLYGEYLLRRMHRASGLKTVVLRVGTIYGFSPGMRFHTAVNKFIFQASLGQSITVWKTAMDQKRPYCDLEDLVGAIDHIVKKSLYNGEVYNIVSNNFTVRQIVEEIRKYVPSLKIKLVDSPIMNQLSYEVDNKKSTAAGFRYNGNIDKAIKQTLKHLNQVNSKVMINV